MLSAADAPRRKEVPMIGEARLEPVVSGLAPVTPGWFVVNLREAAWMNNDQTESCCRTKNVISVPGTRAPWEVTPGFPALDVATAHLPTIETEEP
jgi:hypothetical protein